MTYYCNPWWLGDPAFYETQIFSSEKIRQIWDPCRIFGSASSGIPRAKTSRSQGKTSNGFLKSRAVLKSPWISILSPDLMTLIWLHPHGLETSKYGQKYPKKLSNRSENCRTLQPMCTTGKQSEMNQGILAAGWRGGQNTPKMILNLHFNGIRWDSMVIWWNLDS